jgi:hypothetical protein
VERKVSRKYTRLEQRRYREKRREQAAHVAERLMGRGGVLVEIEPEVMLNFDMNDRILSWTKKSTENAARSLFGSGAWARSRKSKDDPIYWRVVGVGSLELGRGRTWEEAGKKAMGGISV